MLATQGTLLDCLTLVARKACISESLGTVTIREIIFWQAVTPRAQHRQQTEIHPSLSPRKAIFLELYPEGQAPGLPQI